MSKKKKSILGGAIIVVFSLALLVPGMIQAGSPEPSDLPAPWMKTLVKILKIPPVWSQKIAGAERFELVLDGDGVLDKETGLVWEQSPSTGKYRWPIAQTHCDRLVKGGRMGWHLPTIEQLTSLVDPTQSEALPSGHPFSNVQWVDDSDSPGYWSATTDAEFDTEAWYVRFFFNQVFSTPKEITNYAWCARGGQSHDAY